MIWWLFLASVGLICIAGTRAAYTNGFWDGVKWSVEGEGYPSKPHAKWWGWRQLREIVAGGRYSHGVLDTRRMFAQAWCDATGERIEECEFTTTFLRKRVIDMKRDGG